MKIIEERNRIPEIYQLCSKSFEHHHKDSTLTEEEKQRFRTAFSEHALHVHMYTKMGNPKPWNTRFVCEVEGKIAGTVDLYQRNRIRKLFVDPDSLNAGIATALVNKVVEHARDVMKESEISCVTATLKGITFFERFGFVKGEMVKENSYRMVLKLKE